LPLYEGIARPGKADWCIAGFGDEWSENTPAQERRSSGRDAVRFGGAVARRVLPAAWSRALWSPVDWGRRTTRQSGWLKPRHILPQDVPRNAGKAPGALEPAERGGMLPGAASGAGDAWQLHRAPAMQPPDQPRNRAPCLRVLMDRSPSTRSMSRSAVSYRLCALRNALTFSEDISEC
jgi:hypothetical protein